MTGEFESRTSDRLGKRQLIHLKTTTNGQHCESTFVRPPLQMGRNTNCYQYSIKINLVECAKCQANEISKQRVEEKVGGKYG